MIEGVVKTGSSNGSQRGLPDVCVSNGREVVRTDSGGAYRLPQRSEDRFVFVTVPTGYASEGLFYRPVGETDVYDFELRPDPASSEPEFSCSFL